MLTEEAYRAGSEIQFLTRLSIDYKGVPGHKHFATCEAHIHKSDVARSNWSKEWNLNILKEKLSQDLDESYILLETKMTTWCAIY